MEMFFLIFFSYVRLCLRRNFLDDDDGNKKREEASDEAAKDCAHETKVGDKREEDCDIYDSNEVALDELFFLRV